MKAAAFDTTFSNALALKNVGGAYGGADFNPYTKSDTEIQVRVHTSCFLSDSMYVCMQMLCMYVNVMMYVCIFANVLYFNGPIIYIHVIYIHVCIYVYIALLPVLYDGVVKVHRA